MAQSVSCFYKEISLHRQSVVCANKYYLTVFFAKKNSTTESVSFFWKGILSHSKSVVFDKEFHCAVSQWFCIRNSISQSVSCFSKWNRITSHIQSVSCFQKQNPPQSMSVVFKKEFHYTVSQLFSIRNFISQSVVFQNESHCTSSQFFP